MYFILSEKKIRPIVIFKKGVELLECFFFIFVILAIIDILSKFIVVNIDNIAKIIYLTISSTVV